MVDSHIQMPKLLLKQFQNKYNLLCYYDVQNKHVGTKGTAKSINTEFGYYSKETENFLQNEIETPFSKILKYIITLNLNDLSTTDVYFNVDMKEPILDFIYSLIVRAPSFHQMMKESEKMLENYTNHEKRDFIIKSGLKIAEENNIFNEYIITFMINRTKISFVLSMNGIYNYSFNGHSTINLPLTPNVTISLIHKNYSQRVIHEDGAISMFIIDDPEKIMKMNSVSFLSQIKHNWGYVVCPQRDELDRLKRVYEEQGI